MVVLLAEMAKPHTAESRRGMFGNKFGAVSIGNVSAPTAYAALQVCRIGSHHEHVHIVVGFYDYEIGLCHLLLYNFRGTSDIGDEEEYLLVRLYPVPYTITAVVRYAESSQPEVAYLRGL